jgi:hypothetical protein
MGALGFVGRPRRRAGIREDLQLLRELETFPDYFGQGTPSHRVLVDHIELEVAKLSGAVRPIRRKIPWGPIVVYALVGAPLGYLTFRLNENGFRWYSLFPGVVAGLMALAIFGSLLPEQTAPGEEPESAPQTQ